MYSSLNQYIDGFCLAIKTQDTTTFRFLLTLNPGSHQGSSISRFQQPSDFDLYQVPERFRNVVREYLTMMRCVYVQNDIHMTFEHLNNMVRALSRASETQTNWITPVLINCSIELINVHKLKAKNSPKQSKDTKDGFKQSSEDVESLEILAATINSMFKLCLTDKNIDISQSKRNGIYFFLGQLMRIYFELDKLELASSLEKALKGTRYEMPPLIPPGSDKRYSIVYLYYSSCLSLDNSDFKACEEKLLLALKIASYYKDKQKIKPQLRKIFLTLIPVRFYLSGLLPSNILWDQFPILKELYKDRILKAILTGNLLEFKKHALCYRLYFLKNHLMILIERMKSLCHLNLIKKTVKIVQELNGSTSSHIIPLNAIQLSFVYSLNGSYEESDVSIFPLDAIECILAGLIYEGKIKGYISHSNRCIVLSKSKPFC